VAAGASHEVTIVDFGFEPAAATVFVGEPVTWTNTSSRDHTVTSADGNELDSGPIEPDAAYGHVFEAPGSFDYLCSIHPETMRGTIVVEPAPASDPPSGPPTATPPAGTLPPGFSPFPSHGVDSSAAAPSDPGSAASNSPTSPVQTGDTGTAPSALVLLGLLGLAVAVGLVAVWRSTRTGH
jgi:hypothetical protein